MGETYVECLVKRKTSAVAGIIRAGVIAVAVLLGIFGFMTGIFLLLLLAAAVGVGAYFIWLNTDLEYEYLYLDKELVIDKVMAKSKRKRVTVLELERMEILAPMNSYHLDDYKKRTTKETDYSTGVAEQPEKRYVMYYNGERKFILEPSQSLVNAIRNAAPRKVFLD